MYKHLSAVSKNVYIKKLDEIVDKCNITYRRTIRMNPAEVSQILMLNMVLSITTKILNSK